MQVHLKIRSIHKAPASLVRNLPPGNNRTHLFEWVNAPAYDPVLLNVSKEALPLNSSGYWVEVDVTDLVANWISKTTENHGLRLEAFDRKGLNHVFACDNPAQEPEDVKGLSRSSVCRAFCHVACHAMPCHVVCYLCAIAASGDGDYQEDVGAYSPSHTQGVRAGTPTDRVLSPDGHRRSRHVRGPGLYCLSARFPGTIFNLHDTRTRAQ